MATNTKALKLQAAALLMRGEGEDKICETLKIQPGTLRRWRREKVFQQELAALKLEWQQDIEVRAIRLTLNALSAMRYDYLRRTPTIGVAGDMIGTLKNILKNNSLGFEMPQNQQKLAEKRGKPAGISKKAGKISSNQEGSDDHIQDSPTIPMNALAECGDGASNHSHQ